MSETACIELRGWRLAWRRFCTRLLHGGMTGIPCPRCGRESTYWGTYCDAYTQELIRR